MDNLNQIERIKIKLRLAKNTDTFFEVFGASSHKYILNSPLDLQEIVNFEKTYNINLPNTYRTFISEIGNGGLEYKNSIVGNSGAGPGYGIFHLGHPHQFIADVSLGYLEREAFFNKNTTEEEWYRIYDEMDENISDEDYDKEVGKAYSGILNIGYSGCSDYFGIILNGNDKGRIIRTSDEIEYCPRFFEEANILDWYENWLDRIISGDKGLYYNFNIGEFPEEYVVDSFLSDIDDEYWKFKRLGELRSFDRISENSIKKLREKFNTSRKVEQKICVLNFLTKFDYENSKGKIAKLSEEYPMAFLRNIHLYNKSKSIEWLDEINRIKMLEISELSEYIEFVTEIDIKNYRQHQA